MLTGITSCTIGSTKAPPSSTTFWPPRPVRTNARSLLAAQVEPVQQPDDDRDDDRDDDQAEDEAAELGAGHGASPVVYRVIWVKRRVVSVSAISVGSRSIELAP